MFDSRQINERSCDSLGASRVLSLASSRRVSQHLAGQARPGSAPGGQAKRRSVCTQLPGGESAPPPAVPSPHGAGQAPVSYLPRSAPARNWQRELERARTMNSRGAARRGGYQRGWSCGARRLLVLTHSRARAALGMDCRPGKRPGPPPRQPVPGSAGGPCALVGNECLSFLGGPRTKLPGASSPCKATQARLSMGDGLVRRGRLLQRRQKSCGDRLGRRCSITDQSSPGFPRNSGRQQGRGRSTRSEEQQEPEGAPLWTLPPAENREALPSL